MEFIPVISTNDNPIPVDYAIYPSLLDAYLRFKRHDDDETFDSLFDRINKVRTEQTEAQLKGVEFEDCINKGLDGVLFPMVNVDGIDLYKTENFQFKKHLIDKIVTTLSHSIAKQQYLETIIHTPVGNIKLYGIADFMFPEMILDLKGTGSYKCNKYKDNSQHPVYSLIMELKRKPIKAFKYLVSDFEKDFKETYIPNHNMYLKLMQTIFEFINFINHFKSNITDEKIFGGETRSIKTTNSYQDVR